MYAQNLNSYPSVEKTSQEPVPILNQEHDSTLPLTVYGEALSSVPTLMSKSLTPMLHLTDTTHADPYRKHEKGRTNREFVKSSTHHLHRLFCLPLEVCLGRDLPLCYQRNGTKHTAARYAGYDVTWPSPSYTRPYKPSEG